MADAPDPALLRFLKDRYDTLKTQAEKDNDPKNDKIAPVIALIDELYKTINTKDDISHDEIVKQLNTLITQYKDLDLDTASYTRYTDATDNLNMIAGALEKGKAGAEEIGGEE